MNKLEEHEWTIENKKFICKRCGFTPNEEESKFLSSCHWSSYSADIHISDKIISYIPKETNEDSQTSI